jgi:hypothetical protein
MAFVAELAALGEAASAAAVSVTAAAGLATLATALPGGGGWQYGTAVFYCCVGDVGGCGAVGLRQPRPWRPEETAVLAATGAAACMALLEATTEAVLVIPGFLLSQMMMTRDHNSVGTTS